MQLDLFGMETELAARRRLATAQRFFTAHKDFSCLAPAPMLYGAWTGRLWQLRLIGNKKAKMKDKELEDRILIKLYEEREKSMTTFSESTFTGISLREIRRICRQLAERNMVDYLGDAYQNGVGDVTHVRIRAHTIALIENATV